ncbi:MAG: oligopeptide transporter, OPT family [Actinomycetaceae bacterium]|nr:oligopeptide transporter, OPT family [Actinomycetaceae bacterium]
MSSPQARRNLPELTLRGIVLGGVITLLFTAANVYMGLKVGLTFATSIPAAVISMAILHRFKNHSIVENNIVQTIASAAGTLSAIIFVLPGLVIVGWWSGFPYWTTVAVCAVGGTLGVMYSIPLRRALVTTSDLPYPEGVAAAEVLKVGDSEAGSRESRRGMRAIITGAVASATYALLTNMKVVAAEILGFFRVGAGGTMLGSGLGLALVGVGHLVGLSVGISMIVGVAISFGILLPIRSQGELDGPLDEAVLAVFTDEVRYIGAGAMAVAAIWTLLKILRPIFVGIREAAVSSRHRRDGEEVDITERDLPIRIVGLVIAASMVPIGFLLWDFLHGTVLRGTASIVVVSVVFTLVIGIVIAAVCGYMAGLIGASNSPISGVGILVVLIAALLIKMVYGPTSGAETAALIAFTLFTVAIVFGIATISNDNLQDLKTGQLVGATPWKQQVALVIGVAFGSLIIPPVLQLLQNTFGFQGAPGAGKDALAAPQASIISRLAGGIFDNSLDWSLIGIGAGIGVAIVIVDFALQRATGGRLKLPPLAVGMGMYLYPTTTTMIAIGAVIGTLYDRWAERSGGNVEVKKRVGVLMATGLIVGESLFGVAFAGVVAATGNESPLAVVGDGFANPAQVLGVVLFASAVTFIYHLARRSGSEADDDSSDETGGGSSADAAQDEPADAAAAGEKAGSDFADEERADGARGQRN